jgi:hypothetical protein
MPAAATSGRTQFCCTGWKFVRRCPNARKILFFGEAVGAMVKHKVLNLELIRDVYWFDVL